MFRRSRSFRAGIHLRCKILCSVYFMGLVGDKEQDLTRNGPDNWARYGSFIHFMTTAWLKESSLYSAKECAVLQLFCVCVYSTDKALHIPFCSVRFPLRASAGTRTRGRENRHTQDTNNISIIPIWGTNRLET